MWFPCQKEKTSEIRDVSKGELAMAKMDTAEQFHVCTDKQSHSFAQQTSAAERRAERRYLGTRWRREVDEDDDRLGRASETSPM